MSNTIPGEQIDVSRKLIITFMVFALVGALTFIVGWIGNQQSVGLPQQITVETPCPVAGCTQTDGSCHAASAPPVPDGKFVMNCPIIEGCSDTQCHAWDRIDSTRGKPSDASMNLWIVAPVALVIILVLLVKKL